MIMFMCFYAVHPMKHHVLSFDMKCPYFLFLIQRKLETIKWISYNHFICHRLKIGWKMKMVKTWRDRFSKNVPQCLLYNKISHNRSINMLTMLRFINLGSASPGSLRIQDLGLLLEYMDKVILIDFFKNQLYISVNFKKCFNIHLI